MKKIIREMVPEFTIVQQGGPIANHAFFRAEGGNVVAIGIDMGSKNCETSSSGAGMIIPDAPFIVIESGENGNRLKEGLEKQDTIIEFPKYAGWTVWSAECSRYTVAVCLVKNKLEPKTE